MLGSRSSRAPGSRPSLRASGATAPLPGSPQINPFGAEDYTRAPEAHGAAVTRSAAGRAAGQSAYAGGAHAPGWSLGARLRPAAYTAGTSQARGAPQENVEKPPIPQPGSAAGSRRGPSARVAERPSRRDPAPSRLAYRLNRLWLTPLVRRSLTVGLPVFVIALSLGLVMADPVRQDAVRARVAETYDSIIDRPEFRVDGVAVSGAVSPELHAAALARVDVAFPESSFRLDLEALRRSVETLDAVASAELRLGADRKLELILIEREPAAVWRHRGGLDLLDGEGRRIARLGARASRSDLPLIAGTGADAEVPQALAILAAAGPLEPRLRGLVRIGERRWDLVLDRDQRILLPETGAVSAVERVIALDNAQDLLARDVTVVDFRQSQRPTLRLSAGALDTLHSIRHIAE